jgi:hypothetical protein
VKRFVRFLLYTFLQGLDHRVDRSAGLFRQSFELGPPPPHPQYSVSPDLVPGKDTLSCERGGGVGDPNSDKGTVKKYLMTTKLRLFHHT